MEDFRVPSVYFFQTGLGVRYHEQRRNIIRNVSRVIRDRDERLEYLRLINQSWTNIDIGNISGNRPNTIQGRFDAYLDLQEQTITDLIAGVNQLGLPDDVQEFLTELSIRISAHYEIVAADKDRFTRLNLTDVRYRTFSPAA